MIRVAVIVAILLSLIGAILWCTLAQPLHTVTATRSMRLNEPYLISVFSLAKRAHVDCKLDNQVLQVLNITSGTINITTKGEATVPVIGKVPVTVQIAMNLDQTIVTIRPEVSQLVQGAARIYIVKDGKQTRIRARVQVKPTFAVPDEFQSTFTKWAQSGADKASENIIQWIRSTVQ